MHTAFSSLSNLELLSTLCGASFAKNVATVPLSRLFGLSRDASVHEVRESQGEYCVHPAIGAAKELWLRALKEEMQQPASMTSPSLVGQFLIGQMGALEYEVFGCLYLDAQNRLIAFEELFRGTLTQTSVYPREVVKSALGRNAASLILTHNHPSGLVEPSSADEALTRTLKQALALIDVKVIDHLVIAGNQWYSFAENGLL